MDGPIDNHYINMLEQKFENTSFARIDSNTIDKLIDKEDTITSKLNEEEQAKVKKIIEENIDKEKFNVVFESLSETDIPMMITQPEVMRRMKDMSSMGGGGMDYFGSMPDQYNLVINSNHPVITRILKEKDEKKVLEYANELDNKLDYDVKQNNDPVIKTKYIRLINNILYPLP